MLSNFLSDPSSYFQPVVVFLIGAAILSFVGYMNWAGDVKARAVRWIAVHIFRNGIRSDVSADHLFMHVTTILLIVGLLWFGLGVGYLIS